MSSVSGGASGQLPSQFTQPRNNYTGLMHKFQLVYASLGLTEPKPNKRFSLDVWIGWNSKITSDYWL